MTHISIHELLDDILGPLVISADWLSMDNDVNYEKKFWSLREDLLKEYQKFAEIESKLPGDGD